MPVDLIGLWVCVRSRDWLVRITPVEQTPFLSKGNGVEHFASVLGVRRQEPRSHSSDLVADALRALGAADVIVTGGADPLAQAHAAFKAYKPRILLDAVGDQFTADLFFAMPHGAGWVNYGKLSTDAPKLAELGQLIFQSKRIEGFWLTRWMKEVDPARIPQAFATIQDRFVTAAWVTDVADIVPLSEAMTRLPIGLAKPDGKVFIDPTA